MHFLFFLDVFSVEERKVVRIENNQCQNCVRRFVWKSVFFYLELLVKKQCFWTKVQQTKHVATILCVHTFFSFQLVLLVLFKLSRIILWNDSLVFVRGAGFILRRVCKHVQTAQNLMQSFQKKNKTKSQERRKKMNEKLKMMRSPLIFQLKKSVRFLCCCQSVCNPFIFSNTFAFLPTSLFSFWFCLHFPFFQRWTFVRTVFKSLSHPLVVYNWY